MQSEALQSLLCNAYSNPDRGQHNMPAWEKSHHVKLNLKEGQQILRASPTLNDASSLAIFIRILLLHATA